MSIEDTARQISNSVIDAKINAVNSTIDELIAAFDGYKNDENSTWSAGSIIDILRTVKHHKELIYQRQKQ